MTEEYRYLDVNGDRLFAAFHQPANQPSQAVVILHPLGEEKLWAHRVFVSLARDLAEAGIAVLRIDFRGEGDSDRSFEESDLETRIEDACRAIDFLRGISPLYREMTLLGLRFGAAVAAATARLRNDVTRLILWDPIVDGAAYMQSVLRLNLMFQMARHRKVVENRDQLVARLAKGETVNIEGYELAEPLFSQTSGFRLQEMLQRSAVETLIVQISQEEAAIKPELASLADACPRCRIEVVIEEPFWREGRAFCQRAPELTRVTRRALGIPP